MVSKMADGDQRSDQLEAACSSRCFLANASAFRGLSSPLNGSDGSFFPLDRRHLACATTYAADPGSNPESTALFFTNVLS